ncbi:MAG: LysR family transcriptional regulator [Deltaproteobacteria bacterium]|nr:LysR family transcriptional regulator [Deltaproteobacteria bacterium]
MLSQLRRNLWNWLPAFLEIAEAGSVVGAASRLGLTPAAVSRTLGLLEAALGAAVFNRVGNTLVLNAAGIALRDGVREATRAVDAGLSDSLGDPFLRPLRVASLGVLTELVVPALLDLKRTHGELVPEHHNIGPSDANNLLVRGRLDAAFYYEEVTAENVVARRLGQLGASIYCGGSHPLFAARRVARTDVLASAFSIPRVGDAGRVRDGWPSDVPRKIGMRIDLLRSNLVVALSGTLLVVLPDLIAAPHVAAGELRRLSVLAIPPIDVFVAQHARSMERPPLELLIAGVERRIAEASINPRSRTAPSPARSRPPTSRRRARARAPVAARRTLRAASRRPSA